MSDYDCMIYLIRLAYLTFDTIEQATEAKEKMHGQMLLDLIISVSFTSVKPSASKISDFEAEFGDDVSNTLPKPVYGSRDANNSPSNTLVIRNLANDMTIEKLQENFKGAISVRLPRTHSGEHRG